jgi:hypothetical protein
VNSKISLNSLHGACMGQGAHMGQGKRAWLQLGRAQLICACGTAATSVWSAYGLRPSHFNCLRREWSDLTRMEHAWGKAHTRGRRWSNGLTTGGDSVGWRLQAGNESLQWFIHAGWSIWWTIRKWVKQPYTLILSPVMESTIAKNCDYSGLPRVTLSNLSCVIHHWLFCLLFTDYLRIQNLHRVFLMHYL